MSNARIAVLVSGGGTNLQALIDAQKSGILHSGKIELVISNKADAYALTRASDAGIPAAVVIRRDYPDTEAFEKRILDILQSYRIDFIVLAGFLSILSPSFIAQYPQRIINVHPSLIPSFCGVGYYGLRVHEAVLERGVKVSGATVHYVNEVPDGGEIILQKPVYVQEGDTPEILQKRVMREAEWVILPLAAQLVSERISQH